jgi:hypothetical protein
VLKVVVISRLMAVAAMAGSSKLVMSVIVVLIELEVVNVHNLVSCGSHGEPVTMVSFHAQAQVQVNCGC